MMWIVLTKLNGDALTVSSEKLTHIIGRKEGGSSLYLASMVGSEDGRQRVLAAQEDLSEIETRLGLAEEQSAVVKGSRRGAAKAISSEVDNGSRQENTVK